MNARLPLKPTSTAKGRSALRSLEANVFSKAQAATLAVTPHTVKALHSVGVLREWTDGHVLVSREQVTTQAMLIVQGRLRVSLSTADGQEQLLRWMLPGEVSGLSSVFAQATHPTELVSSGTSQVLHVERIKLVDLIGQDSAVAVDLLRVLGLRINQLFDTIAAQATRTLTQKVWASLERFAQFNGVEVADGIQLRVNQSDLAMAVMASRQRVNQQLRQFQQQGLIRLGYRNIVLLGPSV